MLETILFSTVKYLDELHIILNKQANTVYSSSTFLGTNLYQETQISVLVKGKIG